MINLESLGWNTFFQEQFNKYKEAGFEAGRISVEHKHRYRLITPHGEIPAEVTGKLLYAASSSAELPKTGDWCVYNYFEDEQKGIIHSVLNRKSKLSRKSAGIKTDEQVIAANIDIAFVVQSADNNFNIKRLQRYLTMAYEGNIEPVIILNKSDLCGDIDVKIKSVKEIYPDIHLIVSSSVTNKGVGEIRSLIKPGVTTVFTGSSGVGKSTLINTLLGDNVQETFQVRENDSRGRHTTVRRELFLLDDRGMIIDTPGMRELQLWEGEEGISQTFTEIEKLSAKCHFKDCTHTSEIKCAVIQAVESGIISRASYNNYLKLQKELDYFNSRSDKQKQMDRKQKMKQLHKHIRKFNRGQGFK